MNPQCNVCANYGIFSCMDCKQIFYCSVQCEKADKTHAQICLHLTSDFIDLFASEPRLDKSNEPDLSFYPPVPKKAHGTVQVQTNFYGLIQLPDQSPFYFGLEKLVITDEFEIAYTQMFPEKMRSPSGFGLKPYIVYLHGVPTNRYQSMPMLERVSRFLPVITFDMLGMGESSKPRFYGAPIDTLKQIRQRGEATKDMDGVFNFREAWQWHNHLDYIRQLIRQLLPENAQFVFCCDDWGGGQGAHMAEKYNNERDRNDPELVGQIFIDPVSFDGYPVNEIQAIGRASAILNDQQFAFAMGAFDQTLVQIYKVSLFQLFLNFIYRLCCFFAT